MPRRSAERPREDDVELFAELGGLNLLGVFVADGGEHVRENQAAFEEVEGVELLQLVHGEQVPGKEKPLGGGGRIPALVAGVVDGEDDAGVGNAGRHWRRGAQIDGNKRGLPVVDVEDLRDTELLGGFEDGAAVEAEALPVVGELATLGAVEFCRGQRVPDNL